MANRVMGAKFQKLRAQRRRYPRRMDLDKRGPRPNLAVLADYKERAKGLSHIDCWIVLDNGEVMLESQVPVVNAHLSAKAEIDVDAVVQKWDAPIFSEYLSNPAQRIRIYRNKRETKVIIQQFHWLQRMVRLSECFTNMDDAVFALRNNIVAWKIEKPMPSQ